MQKRKDETKLTIRKRNIRALESVISKRREQIELKMFIKMGEMLVGKFPKRTLFCLSEVGSLLADFSRCDPKEFEEFTERSMIRFLCSPITGSQLQDMCTGTFMRS